jgi:hypothetical protein
MSNPVNYTISNVVRGPVSANKCDVTFTLDFTDKSITYPDSSVKDWTIHLENVSALAVDVSGANAAAKEASATADLENRVETQMIPQIRTRRDAEWAKAGTVAVTGTIVVTNKVV